MLTGGATFPCQGQPLLPPRHVPHHTAAVREHLQRDRGGEERGEERRGGEERGEERRGEEGKERRGERGRRGE